MSSENTAGIGTQTTDTTAVPDSGTTTTQSPSADPLSENFNKMKITPSFTIWPPTQRTRDAVSNRLIETLSTPSVLSKRYGTVSPDEATALAKSIEAAAFDTASESAAAAGGAAEESIDGGIEILQVYSKEISKRVLEAVKSRSVAPAAGGGSDAVVIPDVGSGEGEVDIAPPAGDEVSSSVADSESSPS